MDTLLGKSDWSLRNMSRAKQHLTFIEPYIEIISIYAQGGFRVTVILMDKEFKKVKVLLGIVEVNTTTS